MIVQLLRRSVGPIELEADTMYSRGNFVLACQDHAARLTEDPQSGRDYRSADQR